MIKKLFYILIASCLLLPAVAGDITIPKLTIGNDTYKNATISYKGGLTAKISHDEGTKSVPISKLTPEHQTALGITPDIVSRETAKAEVQEKATSERLAKLRKLQAQKQEELARSEEYTVIVYGHTKDAVLAYAATSYEYTTPAITSSLGSVGGGGRSIPASSRTVYSEIKSKPYKITGFRQPTAYKKGKVLHFKAITDGRAIIDGKPFPVLKFLQFIKD